MGRDGKGRGQDCRLRVVSIDSRCLQEQHELDMGNFCLKPGSEKFKYGHGIQFRGGMTVVAMGKVHSPPMIASTNISDSDSP